ncbi:GPP34 family phosphoprotein [Streptomyces sp. NBC_01456]|uniref:GPP34 family phosphoprotein n=1 Tax=unclassified Streptomyces TaxID=2593676 RepID=UPI002E376D1E|nr:MULTISPECIES: GPP34 family phosphoprotein [unclassified Streptomyces]
MTTPRDLLIVAMDAAPVRAVERGDLALALAAAEAIDLLEARAIGLDGERIVPGYRPAITDRLLDEAASSVVQQMPYEPVAEWLWRRGRGLADTYLAALEADGQLTRQRHRRWLLLRTDEVVLVDTPARREAAYRWTSGEPVLVALAAAAGISEERPDDAPEVTDDAVTTVITAVEDAIQELAAERQRRDRRRDDAAVDNVRRGY